MACGGELMNQYRNLTFYAAAAGVALLFFYYLSPILPPFLMGMALAYLGDPICDRLQRWKMSRTVAVTLVFAVMVLAAVVCLLLLVPLISSGKNKYGVDSLDQCHSRCASASPEHGLHFRGGEVLLA